MTLTQRIKNNFAASIQLKTQAMETLLDVITEAAILLASSLDQGNKILSCGNGGSACDAQHFAGEMLNRYLVERRPLAAIALTDSSSLTAIANDYTFDQIFAKQIQALGKPNDVLLAITTSGNSENVVEAIKTAQKQKMNVIALTGGNGGEVGRILNPKDNIEIRVPGTITPRIQEVHILIIHCLCDLIEFQLFEH